MALSTGSKIVVSDISNALAGKQNNLGFAPIQQGGGANQLGNKVYIGWDGGALRCQVDNTDLGQIVTTVGGQTTANYASWAGGCETANYAHSAGRAFPKKTDGGDLNMNWHDHGGHPAYLWGGDDGTNMYVFPPGRLSVNYANSAGWANSANAQALTTACTISVPDGDHRYLPAGGTWCIISGGNASARTVPGGSRLDAPTATTSYLCIKQS